MSLTLEARVAFVERQIDILLRRRGSPFALARSTMSVDDTGPVQTVQAQLDALSSRDKIPLLYGYGIAASPPVEADLHVAFLDGDRAKAVIIASGHQTYRLRGLAVGDMALYDSRSHRVWLTSSGITLTGEIARTRGVRPGNSHVAGEVMAVMGEPAAVPTMTTALPATRGADYATVAAI